MVGCAREVAGASAGRIPAGNQNRIVLISNRATYNTTHFFDIYSVLPDGSGVTRLTDGKRLCFAAAPGAPGRLSRR